MADVYDDVILEFKGKLKEYTVLAYCGRPYVLRSRLKLWLQSDTQALGDGIKINHGGLLLKAVYRDQNHPARPMKTGQLFDKKYGCQILFSILLELDRGRLIDKFLRQEKNDSSLPIDLHILEDIFKEMRVNNPMQIAAEFDKRQWKYCPATLEFMMRRGYPAQRILPFSRKSEINKKGGTAQLFQVEVLEEFVEPSLQKIVKKSGYDPMDGLGWRYAFALKVFADDNLGLFENEDRSFRALENENAMVRFLGCFSHREQNVSGSSAGPTLMLPRGQEESDTRTHNILLEYGESDLEEHFADAVPPYLQLEVEAFWGGLFTVAEGVKSIHNLTVKNDGQKEEFLGWHADIKPDNIIIVHGNFKLADPGFAKFVKKIDNNPPEENIDGGTETFGAPERHPGWIEEKNTARVCQTIDIWSLGCVFSVTATWVVLGVAAVLQYDEMRSQAIRKLVREQSMLPDIQRPRSHLTEGKYFHDGIQVLDAVKAWHDILRSSLRPTDSITRRVLDLVDEKMLLRDPKSRINAVDLCSELQAILKESKKEPRIKVPPSIEELLHEVDKAAAMPSKTRGSSPLGAGQGASKLSTNSDEPKTIADERRSKFRRTALQKTTHRSQVLRSVPPAMPLPPPLHSNELNNSSLATNAMAAFEQSFLASSNSEFQPKYYTEPVAIPDLRLHRHTLSGSSLTASATLTRPALPQRSKTRSNRQNVFQAREEIENREKGNYRDKMRPNPLLKRFYGNRDIKFLVDNGETMTKFWYEATYLLETLLLKAKGQDENGMDLSFTSGSERVEGCEPQGGFLRTFKKDKFMNAMKSQNARPAAGIHTNLKVPLGEILDGYLTEVKDGKRKGKKIKNLTIIILTDGIWAGMKDKDELRKFIVSFVKGFIKEVGDIKQRPLSIQFIQFGDDPDGTNRLRTLDDELVFDGIPDIIDTEPSDQDVNKMLLGSFVEGFDEDEDDDETSPASPNYQYDSVDSYPSSSRQSRTSTLQYSPTSPWAEQTPRTTGVDITPTRNQSFRRSGSNLPQRQPTFQPKARDSDRT